MKIIVASANAEIEEAAQAIRDGYKLQDKGLNMLWCQGIENYTSILLRWLKGNVQISRQSMIELCYVLQLNVSRANDFLTYALNESKLNLRDANELIAYYLLDHKQTRKLEIHKEILDDFQSGKTRKSTVEWTFNTPQIKKLLSDENYIRAIGTECESCKNIDELKILLDRYRSQLNFYSRNTYNTFFDKFFEIFQQNAFEYKKAWLYFSNCQNRTEIKQKLALAKLMLKFFAAARFEDHLIVDIAGEQKRRQGVKSIAKKPGYKIAKNISSWFELDSYMAELCSALRIKDVLRKEETEISLLEKDIRDLKTNIEVVCDILLEKTSLQPNRINEYLDEDEQVENPQEYFMQNYRSMALLLNLSNNGKKFEMSSRGKSKKLIEENGEIQRLLANNFSSEDFEFLSKIRKELCSYEYLFKLLTMQQKLKREDVVALQAAFIASRGENDPTSPIDRSTVHKQMSDFLLKCNFSPLNIFCKEDLMILMVLALGASDGAEAEVLYFEDLILAMIKGGQK